MAASEGVGECVATHTRTPRWRRNTCRGATDKVMAKSSLAPPVHPARGEAANLDSETAVKL